MTKCCETCGHPLPEFEVAFDLTPTQLRFFTIVYKAGQEGIKGSAIMERLYTGADGGPSNNILNVMHAYMKPKLRKHGLALRTRPGPDARWRLEKIKGV